MSAYDDTPMYPLLIHRNEYGNARGKRERNTLVVDIHFHTTKQDKEVIDRAVQIMDLSLNDYCRTAIRVYSQALIDYVNGPDENPYINEMREEIERERQRKIQQREQKQQREEQNGEPKETTDSVSLRGNYTVRSS